MMNWRVLAVAGLILSGGCTAAPGPAGTASQAITPQSAQQPTASTATKSSAPLPTAQPTQQANASTATKPTAQATQPAQAPPKAQAAASIDGVRVTVNGQAFDITGDVKVERQNAMGVSALYVGRNARPSALVGGNGVLLELQTMPGKSTFAVADIGAATFTVWKGVDFSYTSVAGLPNRPIEGLVLSQTPGRLAGSFESNLSGLMGKFPAKIEFGVVLPD